MLRFHVPIIDSIFAIFTTKNGPLCSFRLSIYLSIGAPLIPTTSTPNIDADAGVFLRLNSSDKGVLPKIDLRRPPQLCRGGGLPL